MRADAPIGLTQPAVVAERRRVGPLVRRNDVDAPLEPFRIQARHRVTRRAVDQHGVRQVIGVDVLREPGQIRGLAARVERSSPRFEIDGLVGEQHPLRCRDGADAQVDVEIVLEPA